MKAPPARPEKATKQVDPKKMSPKSFTPKKNEDDVMPTRARPKGKMGSKKLDNIRI